MATVKKAAKPFAKKPVWNKKNPVTNHKHLTAAQKATAKKRSAKAGRPYPNMVDNMAVAKGEGSNSPASKKKIAAKKPVAKKTTTKKTAAKKVLTKAKATTAKKTTARKTAAKKPGPKNASTRKTTKK